MRIELGQDFHLCSALLENRRVWWLDREHGQRLEWLYPTAAHYMKMVYGPERKQDPEWRMSTRMAFAIGYYLAMELRREIDL